MDEQKETAAALPLSDQPAAARQQAAPAPAPAAAAAPSRAATAAAAPMHLPARPWMQEEGKDVSLPPEPSEPSEEERRGGRSHLQPAAPMLSRSRPSVAAASAAASPPLFSELPPQQQLSCRTASLRVDSLPQEWFVDSVPDELICSACTDVARDPPNLEACSHAVCRECLTKLRVRSTDCPVCRQSFAHAKLASQPFAQSMVWRLRVRCVQHEKGCGWHGQLGTEMRELKAHDAACQFKEATCLGCNNKCLLKDMSDHRRNCPRRWVTCASCQQRLQFYDFADHQPAIKAGDGIQGRAGSAATPAPSASSSSPANPSGAASSNGPLLPLVPPCRDCEACPRGCEDPKQPGHVSVYLRSQQLSHERSCTQQLVSCTLCDPAHTLTPRQLIAHIGAVMDDPHRRQFAQQQVAKMIVQGPALTAAVGSADAASSPSAAAASSSNAPSRAASTSPAARRLFRDGLKVGDLVDFHSHAHGGWFVGEVTRIDKSWAGLRPDDVSVHIRQFDDSETVQRDSSRLWPPCTKSAPLGVAAAAAGAAAFSASSSSFAAAFAPVRTLGQVPASHVPPAAANFGYQLRKGDACDCLDTEQKWRISEVIGSDSTHWLIHYVGWSPKWDEWIPKGDPRIQPPRSRTQGYTGPANKRPTLRQAAARLP